MFVSPSSVAAVQVHHCEVFQFMVFFYWSSRRRNSVYKNIKLVQASVKNVLIWISPYLKKKIIGFNERARLQNSITKRNIKNKNINKFIGFTALQGFVWSPDTPTISSVPRPRSSNRQATWAGTMHNAQTLLQRY